MTANAAFAYAEPLAQERRKPSAGLAIARLAEDFPYRPLRSQAEAENLFMIDAAQTGESAAWEAYFVESMLEFLLHRARPTARISPADEAWLLAAIGDEPSPSLPALMRALAAEAEDLSPALAECARRMSGDRG